MTTDVLIRKLRQDKKRITPGRRKILENFCNTNSPLSADILVKKTGLNKTSVYRELNFLTAEKIIQQVDLGDGIKRHELEDSSHHHHLVCIKCRKIKDVQLDESNIKNELFNLRVKNFTVVKHNLEFFGYCHTCK